MALPEGVDLRELSQAQLAEVQNLLRRAGYDTGPVDGQLGDMTWQAWARFLTRNGMNASLTAIPQFVSSLSATTAPEVWNRVVFGSEINSPVSGQRYLTPPPVPTGVGIPGEYGYRPTGEASQMTAEEESDLRKRYPDLSYLLDTNPEVRNVLVQAVKANPPWSPEETRAAIMQTAWFKQTSQAIRAWDDEFARDNATAMAKWQQRTLVIRNKIDQLGLAMEDKDVEWLSGRVVREGWSDEQLNRYLGNWARKAGPVKPGAITADATTLKKLARGYMTSMTDTDAVEFATRIFEGSLSMEGVETMLKEQAKNRFSWLSGQIDSGLKPMELFAANRNAVADILEMSPEQIDLNDVRWSELTSPIMENGITRSMNFYEAQRWARNRPEWRNTDNANREASKMTMTLLRTMGMIA